MAFPLPDEFHDQMVTAATVTVGGTVPAEQSFDTETGEVVATLASPFAAAGLVRVSVTVTAGGGHVSRELEPIVVESALLDGWLTLETARRLWPDAPDEDEALHVLLAAARNACVAWLGGRAYVTGEGGDEVPVTPSSDWRQAQLMQARAIWQAGRVNRDGGELGLDTIQLFPLNRDIRNLLIPKTRVPRWGR
ncbi:phage gp6-like head-tail connector protein [Schumannella soli]|uniref:Phage gp6-like head-tail connector protein n=1 Tax=Schumannella soli TaxID=2590779 RepID=A0A506XSZ2_9MICO|nr:phage gp6-like head-tail connector protein [Schumannella soli]TPW75894.1 phage gp6-like head-tail connector protein [Schumannella soli]